jgi:hypothetical protein
MEGVCGRRVTATKASLASLAKFVRKCSTAHCSLKSYRYFKAIYCTVFISYSYHISFSRCVKRQKHKAAAKGIPPIDMAAQAQQEDEYEEEFEDELEDLDEYEEYEEEIDADGEEEEAIGGDLLGGECVLALALP